MMKRHLLPRLTAAILSLSLLSAPAALALTTEQAAELLQEIYIDEVPQSVLDQPTVEEMVAALGDPYTEYFTADEYADFTASMSDASLVGIGVVFAVSDDGLLIQQVLSGSPAQEGGLLAGDLILAVDGKSVLGLETDAITGMIQGEEGSDVSLTYLREGKERTVTLTRALVVVPATTYELLDDHIGYISCTTFGSETVGHFEEAIETCGGKADVWIVDLRSNLGGVTTAATEAAGLFTGSGAMAYLRDGAGEYSAFYREEDAATIYPVIVLVDQWSASASELFASAIRDRGAGIVVGTRTYGKGVAQTVVDQETMPEYFPDGDAIKITSHRFFSPDGNTTDQVGVIPDLLVAQDQILDVACLLATDRSAGDTDGFLRVDITWRWNVDLESAASPDHREAFLALLNALPENASLWLGTGGPTGWRKTTAAEMAETCELDYIAPCFTDQDDSDYSTAVSVLKTYDLIHGKGDGAFHPQDTLTRAELCQMLAEALNCTVPTNESPFTDVSDDAWYAPAVTAMSNMGLVNGVGGGLFRPEDPVDHQQLITILGRLAQRLNLYLYNDAADMTESNTDLVGLMDYADWAKPSAWLLSYSQKGYFGNTINLLWDEAHKIDPTASATRDEAACALYNLLSYTGVLPA